MKSVMEVYSAIAAENPRWSSKEEAEFIRTCTTKSGKWRSRATKDKFVNEAMKHNLGLVFKIVNKMAFNKNEDVLQKAVIGMVEALKKYDPKRKGKISTWITNPIRWAVMQHQNTYSKSGLISEELSALNHRYNTHLSVMSLDKTIGGRKGGSGDNDRGDTIASIISVENVSPDFVSARDIKTQRESNHETDIRNGVGELRKRMHLFLNKKEMYVVCRTLDGVSQTDISIELKLSRMRISQLMASAFRKIRNSPIGSRLKEYIK